MTRPDDWWPDADRAQGWHELPVERRRLIKRYNPQAGVMAGGAMFDCWESIPLSDIKAGDIFQVYTPQGIRIDNAGDPLPAHLAFRALADATKALAYGLGYEVERTRLVEWVVE